jgi:SSS family solute:Na+ symporter
MPNIQIIDIVVIAAYFAVLIAVGVIIMKRTKSTEDYLVAGRRLPLPIFICAMSATTLGGGSTIGGSSLSYSSGIGGFWLNGMYFLSIFLLALLLSTKLSNMRIFSTSEGIGVFYGPYARLLSAVINLIYLIILAVLQIISVGSILSILTGWSTSTSMIVGACVILAYIMLGGMWAMALTDVLQVVIMTIGVVILVPIFALPTVGGFEGLAEKLPPSHFDIGDIGLQRIIAYVILLVPGFLAGQDFWQKAFTAKNKKVMVRGTMLSSFYILIYGLGIILFGMCMYAADPNLADTNTVFANAAVTFMPQGVKGVVLAAALAAIMSTANGAILGSATVFFNDVVKDRIKIPAAKEVLFTRLLCAVVTIVAVLFALYVQSVLVALDVAYAYIAGCIFVPLIFAFILKKVSARAGFYSLIASFVTVTVLFFIYGITALEPIIFGILVSAVSFFVINGIDKKKRVITFTEEGKVRIDGKEETALPAEAETDMSN